MSPYVNKNIERYLVLDWTDDSIRVLKNRPEMNPGEIPVKVNLKVKVPKNKIPEINEEVELDQTRMEDLETEEIPYEEMKKQQKEKVEEKVKSILEDVDKIPIEELWERSTREVYFEDREVFSDIIDKYNERDLLDIVRKNRNGKDIIVSKIVSVDELLKEEK